MLMVFINQLITGMPHPVGILMSISITFQNSFSSYGNSKNGEISENHSQYCWCIYTDWWFQTFVIFHFIDGMPSFPLTFTPSFFKMGTLHHQPVLFFPLLSHYYPYKTINIYIYIYPSHYKSLFLDKNAEGSDDLAAIHHRDPESQLQLAIFAKRVWPCRHFLRKVTWFLTNEPGIIPSGKHTKSYWKWPSRNSGFAH